MVLGLFPPNKGIVVAGFTGKPVGPKLLDFRIKGWIVEEVIVEMPVSRAMRLLIEIKRNRNEVMIRLGKRGNWGAGDVGAKRSTGEKFIDACPNDGIVVACVPASLCVVTFMGIPVVPDVSKVKLGYDSVKNVYSTLSGFGIPAEFIEL